MKPRIEWLLNGGGADPHERHHKGGGSSGPYYENLNQLYGEQAALGRTMRGVAEQDVIPAYRRGLQKSDEYGSIANQEYMAGRAGADTAGAYSGAVTDLTNQIASTGTQLNDPQNVRTFANLANSGAANQAAAMTGARERVVGKADADTQWWTSLGMGTPSQASTMLGSAAGGYGNMITMKNQEEAQSSQNVANAIQGGYNLYKMWTGKDGGYVKKMANGGFMSMPKVTPPPPSTPPKPQPTPLSTASGAAQGARMGKGMAADAGAAVKGIGNVTGNANMQAFGAGMQTPSLGAYEAATQMVDKALPQMLGETAANYGTTLGSQQTAMLAMQDASLGSALTPVAADAAGSAAAGIGADAAASSLAAAGTEAALGTAATEAAAGSLLAGGAGATAAAAMPWVGAAVLGLDAITGGKVLGIFADGGMVTPGSNGVSGGEVDGPGGPQDDEVPALLSDGEFVMNAEAVQHFGLDRLNKMNQKGLEIRRGLQRS